MAEYISLQIKPEVVEAFLKFHEAYVTQAGPLDAKDRSAALYFAVGAAIEKLDRQKQEAKR